MLCCRLFGWTVLVAGSGFTTKAPQKMFESKRWFLTHWLISMSRPQTDKAANPQPNPQGRSSPILCNPVDLERSCTERMFLKLQFAADEFKILGLPVCLKSPTNWNILQIINLTLVRSHLTYRPVNFCPRNHYWWRSTVISYWKPQPAIDQSINQSINQPVSLIVRCIAWLFLQPLYIILIFLLHLISICKVNKEQKTIYTNFFRWKQ